MPDKPRRIHAHREQKVRTAKARSSLLDWMTIDSMQEFLDECHLREIPGDTPLQISQLTHHATVSDEKWWWFANTQVAATIKDQP